MMATWPWMASGVVLAAAFVSLARRGSESRERRILAIGLLIATAVYVGSAVWVGGVEDILLALTGVGFFLGMAATGIHWGAGWLAAGWTIHVGWDGLLHYVTPGVAPAWYALLCLGFDLTVAGALLGRRPSSP